jgi:hypothetical protein
MLHRVCASDRMWIIQTKKVQQDPVRSTGTCCTHEHKVTHVMVIQNRAVKRQTCCDYECQNSKGQSHSCHGIPFGLDSPHLLSPSNRSHPAVYNRLVRVRLCKDTQGSRQTVHSSLTSVVVSDQLLALATLPLVPSEQRAGWAPVLDWKFWEDKILLPLPRNELWVIQPVG